MKKYLLFSLVVSVVKFGNAQTDTYFIDWSFGSNPSATGAANSNRTIEEGDTVTWNWYASGNHNLVSQAGSTESFSSSLQGPGSTFSYTFTQVGTNDYVCVPHSGNMFGAITVVPEGTLNTQEFSAIETVALYPNPASDILNLNFDRALSDNLELTFYSTLGKKVKSIKDLNPSRPTIDISDLNTGLYLLRIEDGNKAVTKRLIVK